MIYPYEIVDSRSCAGGDHAAREKVCHMACENEVKGAARNWTEQYNVFSEGLRM